MARTLTTPLPRGMVFVDFPNVTCSSGAYGTLRLNFAGLARVLTESVRTVGIMAYVADLGSRQGLFREMSRAGFEVKAVSPGKSVDGRLIFDLIVGAQRNMYDVCILASGDRDYVPVVEETKTLGKTVWVASFPSAISPALQNVADKYIDLDQRTKDIILNRKLFPTNCADCGNAFQLPFPPVAGKPFYCSKCLPKHRRF